ncbi:MAG: prepilin-type N-terminal cleavage/methylation domain-containing protein [Rhodospirillales bacterium]|nr:prepilin-type N-terminal cleavage/methylation domain-containing protein [Rhodospirillales bacterium]
MHKHKPSFANFHRAGGFNLMEVLIAIGIFAIGFTAVVSLVPVGIALQRETVFDAQATQFASNAEAIILARGFDETIIDAAVTQDATVIPVSNAFVSPTEWTLEDRSYNVVDILEQRTLFWVPLFFDASVDASGNASDTRDWRVYVFVVRGKATTGTYPKTTGTWANPADPSDDPGVPGVTFANATPGVNSDGIRNRFDFTNTTSGRRLVRAGDRIVADDGTRYRVKKSDSGGIEVDGIIPAIATGVFWYAHPGDTGSSTYVDLLILQESNGNNLIR